MKREMKKKIFRLLQAAAMMLILICMTVPVRAEEASGEVLNNGGRFVGYQGNTYYWRMRPESMAESGVMGIFNSVTDVKNELVCRNAQGEEQVLLEDCSTGILFVCGNTVFYERKDGEWASYSLTGGQQNVYPSQFLMDAGTQEKVLVGRRDGNTYFLLQEDGGSIELGNFDYYLGIHDGFVYFGANTETELVFYRVGPEGTNAEELGRIAPASGISGTMGTAADSIMGKDELYVLVGGYQGTGNFFEGYGIYAISYNGGIRTLVDAAGTQRITYPKIYLQESESGNKLYYASGDGYSNVGAGYYPMDEGIYAVDLATGVKETASFILSHIGERISVNGNLQTLLDNSGNYTQILTPQMVEKLGFGQLNGNMSEAQSFIRYLDIVGDTAYFTIMDIEEDPSSSVGWRTGYRRGRTQTYAVKIGTEEPVLVNDFSVGGAQGQAQNPEVNPAEDAAESADAQTVSDPEVPEAVPADKIGSDADAFQSVIASLQKKYGIFQACQKGTMHSNQDTWMDPRGLMSADVLDLDLDGKAEMLACFTEATETEGRYQIVMQVFEEKDGKIFLADSKPLAAFYEQESADMWSPNVALLISEWTAHLLEMNAVWAGGRCYIACEEYDLAKSFANGKTENTWLLAYGKNGLEYVCSFTQTAGGSSDFAYTGYEFSEGTLSDSALYYNEWADKPGLYGDFPTAIQAMFQKFGVKIKEGNAAYHGNEMESVLSDENDKKRIFKYVNDATYSDYSTSRYDYMAYLISDLVGDGREKASETEAAANTADQNAAANASNGAAGGEYVLENSDKMYLTDADIQNLTLQEINYAKNEIYARKGRKFLSQELQNYFNSKSWYQGTVAPENFTDSMLNEYEKVNAEFLSRVEFSMSPNGYQLDQ